MKIPNKPHAMGMSILDQLLGVGLVILAWLVIASLAKDNIQNALNEAASQPNPIAVTHPLLGTAQPETAPPDSAHQESGPR